MLVRYGFEELGLAQICGVTALENRPSQAVLLKAGLLHIGRAFFYDSDVEFFAVTAERFAV